METHILDMTGKAAMLVLLLTMLNYKAKYQYDLAKKAASGSAFPQILPVRQR